MYYCESLATCRPVRFREAEKARVMHIICTHKNTHTFLVTAPSPHLTLTLHSYPLLTAQKKRP